MRKELFSGCGVALVTPFQPDGSLDVPALERLVDHVINGGVDFIVSLGTTGEAVSQSRQECIEVMRLIHDFNHGRVPLVAGPFGSNSTTALLHRFQDYAEVLALRDYVALMSSVPSYVKPNQQGIFQHFVKVAEAAPLPVLLYNVPARTGIHMRASTTVALAKECPNIFGVKEASGDMIEGALLLRDRPADFKVFSGDDTTALALMGLGADGVISVVANAYPELFSQMSDAALSGDFKLSRKLNNTLLDLHPLLYCDGNPGGIKAVLSQLSLCDDYVRLPLAGVTETTRDGIVDQVLKIEAERAVPWA